MQRFASRKDGISLEGLLSNVPDARWNDWRWQLKNCLKNASDILEFTGISAAEFDFAERAASRYHMSVTPYYLSLSDLNDASDPIRRQWIPRYDEIACSDCADDPLEEERDMVVPGLIHRYPDRVLAIVAARCAVYCRHCNRKRRWERADNDATIDELEGMAEYISGTSTVREVIISGGDPLMLETDRLEGFIRRLREISHVEVIRIGSRMPVVLPCRITPNLCAMLEKYRPLWFLTQFNHPWEITPEAAGACEMLLRSGIPVLNQSVLLKGVNDSYETMRKLLYGLQKISVKPYYLFQCEPVRGGAHFIVDMERGKSIVRDLWRSTSGLCIPRYVYDLPGGEGKLPLDGAFHSAAD